jgi:hypothetical protein
MTRLRLSLCAGLALLGACATAPGSAYSDGHDQYSHNPADVAAIRTYWMGARPACEVTLVRQVQANSENGLRWAAWNYHAEAVVGVRTVAAVGTPHTGQPSRRVYQGDAVGLGKGCSQQAEPATDPATSTRAAAARR